MQKTQRRGRIERRIVTSIIWVGVIPMLLALVVGYLAARGGQGIAVRQNLVTAARKTSEGVNLAVEARIRMAGRAAQELRIVSALRQQSGGRIPEHQTVLRHLQSEASRTGSLRSVFALYDREGSLLLSTEALDEEDHKRSEWVWTVLTTRIVDFSYYPHEGRYALRIASPVRDPENGVLLGFLMESQGVDELLRFVLAGAEDKEHYSEKMNYEVVYMGETIDFVIAIEDLVDKSPAPPDYSVVDSQRVVDLELAKHLQYEPESSAYYQLQYNTRNGEMPVMLACHRLLAFPSSQLFLVVYRSSLEVYSNINLAALLTLMSSALIIFVFCIVAYRIVNNNIIRPVSLLNEGAQIIRQGDLDLKLKIDTGDEIEELASSFNKMASALRHNITQLEESEERYRSLITSMRDGIFQANTDGTLTLINPAGVGILGYGAPQDIIGLNLRELFIEEIDYAHLTSAMTKSRFVERTRVWMRKLGGRSICVELSCNRVFDDTSRFVGMEGTFRDVTQNVRLEQEAKERADRISAINQIANAINSSLEAGRVYESLVVEVRKLVDFDYAAVALLDEHAESPSGGPVFSTRQLWPESRQGHLERRQDNDSDSCATCVAQERRPLIVDDLQAEKWPFESQFPGGIRSCLCVPLYATGRIIGTLNLGSEEPKAFTNYERDVFVQISPHVAVAIRNARLLENLQHSLEEVTRAREKLHDANEELKTLDEMKTNLLSNVSHELRTPLVAVMGYTDMILNGKVGPVNEVQGEYLGISLRNIEKLVTLIENLLDFSRLHRGAEELVFDTFDLVDCARTSIEIIQPVADSREIEVSLVSSEPKVLIEGDRGKLGQVFNNLLSNAVKFNENGGEVKVDIRVGEDAVDVTVSDTGIGIPVEAQDKIFTRFYQYDGSSTRKYGGTGIGLSIAQDIMRLHGSRLTVTSKEGQGSTFRFSFPMSTVQARSREGGAASLPLPTETHLLIELVTQDRALSAQIRNLLLSEGMDVIHAAYPAVALSLAAKYSPDCLLVDTEAGPLGRVVVEEIVAEPGAMTQLPVVLLTNDDDLYERYRARVSGRVKRGFRKSTLLSGIHYALSRGVRTGAHLGNKVLCVDDDREIVEFISRCLETEGYQTDRCATGEEAIERLAEGGYWLVLLDIAMPGIDGWETCQRIKADANLAGIKVYMVTAKPIDKSITKIHESGADGYLLKPFRSEDLIELIQSFEGHEPGDFDADESLAAPGGPDLGGASTPVRELPGSGGEGGTANGDRTEPS